MTMKTNPSSPVSSPASSPSVPIDAVLIDPPVETVATVAERVRVFRRKPLLVQARQIHVSGDHEGVHVNPGDWVVTEAGKTFVVRKSDFVGLYEVVDTDENGAIDAGLADLDPGTWIERNGKRMVRVTVTSGRGPIAYWVKGSPNGTVAGHAVIADMTDNAGASHRAGRFVEPFEGKPGTRTWVEP